MLESGGIDLNKVACIEHRDGCCCLFLDLHKHNKLETLKVRNSSVDGLHLPVEGARITSLILYNVTITHHGLKHLVESLTPCSSLETIKLSIVTCSEHRDGCCCIGLNLQKHYKLEKLEIDLNKVACIEHRDGCCCLFLDLHKHNKLETLKVRNSYVDSLCLPVEGARITSLELDVVTMTRHSCEQLGKSLTSCSSLERIELKKVTCSEHRDGCCCIGLNLQKHYKLEKLEIQKISVEGMLLPVEGASITSLILYSVTMTHHGLEHLVDTLSSYPGLKRKELNNLICLSLETMSLETVSLNEVTHKHRDNSCILFHDLHHNNMKVQNSYVDSLRLPVEGARTTSLEMNYVTMTYHGLEQLKGFCSHRHNKLKVQNSYVYSLRLPVEEARIASLEMHNVTMTHHGLKQLRESFSSCSSLKIIELNKVTCSEHRDGCCCIGLNLQKHYKLEKLEIQKMA